MTIIDSTISDNFVTENGFGGAIWNTGQLTVTSSTMSGNSVSKFTALTHVCMPRVAVKQDLATWNSE
jgi:hypothetical protein